MYDDGHLVVALHPTDLTVDARDYVTITGPSGAGKSTLLNVLGLLDKPSAGTYLVRGGDVAGMAEPIRGAVRGQLFGFVFQAFHLLSGRSALDNVALGMLYGPHSRKERRRRAVAALERVHMGHRADADPRTLSGGEKQRVAIARAIAGNPTVLFCDEPTGNLDSANTENVLETLDELHGSGLTLIVVTHDQQVALRGNRRLTVLDGVVSEEIR
ncbi:Methionine ABC transporter ATP-binding protein [Alloactinosynnema sp. L-07]|nr:Methionine ABC transporter ATP-binding protein [Alloactinosynnema sp. L-07]